nr:unnamed protein product [Meloidogyne enterolobii]
MHAVQIVEYTNSNVETTGKKRNNEKGSLLAIKSMSHPICSKSLKELLVD